MNKGEALQKRLAQSLDQANQREAKSNRRRPLPATLPAERKCSKLSISLFSGDLARLNSIRDYMTTRGHRLSTSQIIKLALRTAPLSDEMMKALDAIQAEDGRKW